MKRYWKVLVLCVAILLLGALVLGCGGDVVTETQGAGNDTEGTQETDGIKETEKPKHEHASSGEPLEVVEATCREKGQIQYRCDECRARYVVTTPVGQHDYKTQYDTAFGYDVVKCNGCGDWRMEVDGNEEIGFAAVCSGDISVTFDVLGSVAEIEFIVDGEVVSTSTYEKGEHTVTLAKGLAQGNHTFGFVLKNGGTALDLTKVDVDGEFYRFNAVILEMTKAPASADYSDFYVYVQTSDPSGNYYVRYRFYYSYSTKTTNTTNSPTNISTFRISAAELVKVSAITDTSVTYTALCSLLSSGEISLAVKEYDYDPEQKKNTVADFCGGFHGDEHIATVGDEKQLFLKADGVLYTPGAEKKVVRCSSVTFDQITLLDRWAATAGSKGQFAKHTQNFEITSLGMSVDREVEWLVDDFVIDSAYPMMFTLLRIDGEKAVCEIVSTYDANGNLIASEVLALHNTEKQKSVLQNAAVRRVEFSSATSGVFSTASFTLGENNDGVLGSPYIAYRLDKGGADNKLYVPMKGSNAVTASANTTSGTVTKSRPSLGDVWEISCFYNIDYVNPEN